MEKKKDGMASIQFWIHVKQKAKLERYCRGKGQSLAEGLRCIILHLPEEDENNSDGVIVQADAGIGEHDN